VRILRKIAEGIWKLLEAKGLTKVIVSREELERLHVNEDINTIVRETGIKTVTRMILVILAATLICLSLILVRENVLLENDSLQRPGIGEGSREYRLEVAVGDGEYEETAVSVTEQKAAADKYEEIFEKATKRLFLLILGENESLTKVTSSLDFVKKIDDMPVEVIWEEDESGCFSPSGRLRIVPEEPREITLNAVLSYFDTEKEIQIPVTIVPAVKDNGREIQSEILKTAVKEADRKDPDKDLVSLPQELDQETVSWREPAQDKPLLFIILGIACAVMLIPAGRSALKDKHKKRKAQMERDFPDIVSKLILLLAAGMTCRAAWQKICSDYLLGKKMFGKRFAYEEMVLSMRELDLGRSETAVYEDFGIRCGLTEYKRLATLLSGNLRRGSSRILEQLELESRDAYAVQLEAVRKRGEETSTKLLVPMMGMLVIVIAIIVVPAFMGVNTP